MEGRYLGCVLFLLNVNACLLCLVLSRPLPGASPLWALVFVVPGLTGAPVPVCLLRQSGVP